MPLDLSVGWGDQRYAEGEAADPEDISDPHTDEDESATSLTDKLLQFRWWALAFGGLVFFGLLWLGFFVTSFAPAVLTNPWTHRLTVAGLIAFGGYRIGYSSRKSTAEETDELVLVEAHRTRRFRGEYSPSEGSAPRFKLYKGLRGFGPFKSQEPYRVGEISDEVATLRANPNTSVDDPALVRIDQGARADSRMFWEIETDTGTVVVALTGTLEPTGGPGQTVLRTTIPKIAHEEELADLEEALEEQRRMAKTRAQEKQVLQNQLDQVLELAETAPTEQLDMVLDAYERIEQASGYHGRRGEEDDAPPLEPVDDLLEGLDGDS